MGYVNFFKKPRFNVGAQPYRFVKTQTPDFGAESFAIENNQANPVQAPLLNPLTAFGTYVWAHEMMNSVLAQPTDTIVGVPYSALVQQGLISPADNPELYYGVESL
jgi:hypothetical protein